MRLCGGLASQPRPRLRAQADDLDVVFRRGSDLGYEGIQTALRRGPLDAGARAGNDLILNSQVALGMQRLAMHHFSPARDSP